VVEPLRFREVEQRDPRRGGRMADEIDGRLVTVAGAEPKQLVGDVRRDG
jgi:hypothetical protein